MLVDPNQSSSRRSSPWTLLLALLFGLGASTAATWVSARSAARPVPTQSSRLPGLRHTVPTDVPLTIHGGDLKMSALRSALPKGASANRTSGEIRVQGVGAGHLAAIVYSLKGGKNATITRTGQAARPKALTKAERDAVNEINEAMVRVALSTNFGRGFTGDGGDKSQVERSVYPVPTCMKMQCDSCGDPPEGGLDCSDLKDARDRALDELSEAEATVAIWQAALQAHKDMAFYGGIAGMVSDMVSAATTVLSAGTATGAARAGARLLIQMARDGALEALMEELGIPGLADMSEAAVEAALSKAETKRVAAAAKYAAAHKAWVDCMNDPAAMSASELAEYRDALKAWNRCRYNVYFGLAPQCELVEVACP